MIHPQSENSVNGISIFHSSSELAITQPSEEIVKRTSIYYTRPPPQNATGASRSVSKLCTTPSTSQTTAWSLKPRNVDVAPAARSQVASCARKKVAWADEGTGPGVFEGWVTLPTG